MDILDSARYDVFSLLGMFGQISHIKPFSESSQETFTIKISGVKKMKKADELDEEIENIGEETEHLLELEGSEEEKDEEEESDDTSENLEYDGSPNGCVFMPLEIMDQILDFLMELECLDIRRVSKVLKNIVSKKRVDQPCYFYHRLTKKAFDCALKDVKTSYSSSAGEMKIDQKTRLRRILLDAVEKSLENYQKKQVFGECGVFLRIQVPRRKGIKFDIFKLCRFWIVDGFCFTCSRSKTHETVDIFLEFRRMFRCLAVNEDARVIRQRRPGTPHQFRRLFDDVCCRLFSREVRESNIHDLSNLCELMRTGTVTITGMELTAADVIDWCCEPTAIVPPASFVDCFFKELGPSVGLLDCNLGSSLFYLSNMFFVLEGSPQSTVKGRSVTSDGGLCEYWDIQELAFLRREERRIYESILSESDVRGLVDNCEVKPALEKMKELAMASGSMGLLTSEGLKFHLEVERRKKKKVKKKVEKEKKEAIEKVKEGVEELVEEKMKAREKKMMKKMEDRLEERVQKEKEESETQRKLAERQRDQEKIAREKAEKMTKYVVIGFSIIIFFLLWWLGG